MRKEIWVMFCVIPIIGRTVVEVMQRRQVHRMIRGADARKAGDVGEFANLRVGDIGVPVTIRIITHRHMVQSAATPNLGVGTQRTGRDVAIGMNKWVRR